MKKHRSAIERITDVCFDLVWEHVCEHGCAPKDYQHWGQFCKRLHEIVALGIAKATLTQHDDVVEILAQESAAMIQNAEAAERERMWKLLRKVVSS